MIYKCEVRYTVFMNNVRLVRDRSSHPRKNEGTQNGKIECYLLTTAQTVARQISN